MLSVTWTLGTCSLQFQLHEVHSQELKSGESPSLIAYGHCMHTHLCVQGAWSGSGIFLKEGEKIEREPVFYPYASFNLNYYP